MSVCIQYTRTRSQGVCDTLSPQHTHTRGVLCGALFVKGAFLVAIIRRGPFKDQKRRVRICKWSPGTMAKLHFARLSIKFALALKRRDFVLHTDNAASGINYGPFNCLNSWPSGAWVPDGRMDGSGADRLFAWRRARAGCIAQSFSQGALLNLAGDCLPVGAQFFVLLLAPRKYFSISLTIFNSGRDQSEGNPPELWDARDEKQQKIDAAWEGESDGTKTRSPLRRVQYRTPRDNYTFNSWGMSR